MIDGNFIVALIGLAGALVLVGARLRGMRLSSARIIRLAALWIGIILLAWSVIALTQNTH